MDKNLEQLARELKRHKLYVHEVIVSAYPLGAGRSVRCVFSLLLLGAGIQAFRRCFLCFIARTSGLKALHLTKSITPQYALALLLCSRLHFLHLRAPLSLCAPAPPSTILLVNYLFYFVSELMSDIKRRMEPDSKIQKWFPLCCLRQ